MMGPAGDLDVERAALLAAEAAPSDGFSPEVRPLCHLYCTLLATCVLISSQTCFAFLSAIAVLPTG